MKRQLFYLLGLSAIFFSPGLAVGQHSNFNGFAGSTWSDAANWDAGIPVAGINAHLEGGHTVELATDQTINELDVVGDQNDGTTILNHSVGTLLGGDRLKVGGGPDGGGGLPADGTYNLSGTAVVDGFMDAYIGFNGGTGAMNLSNNATLNLSRRVRLAAFRADNTGTLSLADSAVMNVGGFVMGGDTSSATVNQTGGAINSDEVIIGTDGSAGTSVYDISAGSVSAFDGLFAVGGGSTGTLNVSGTAEVFQATTGTSDPEQENPADRTFTGILVGGIIDGAIWDNGSGALNITGSSASIIGADLRIGLTRASTGALSWTADAGGITGIVSGDNTEFRYGTSTLSLDFTADSNSSVDGTQYLLVDNSAAVRGTFTGLPEGATVSLGGGNTGTISYVGGADGFDIVVTVGGSGGPLACDVEPDMDCDIDDMDALYAVFGAAGGNGQFDFDADGDVDTDDINSWLTAASTPANQALPTATSQLVLGDVDLDGDVDSSDLGLLLNNFNDTNGAGWGGGDLNGDQNVNSSDLGLLLNRFNFTSAAAASAVPEPNALILLIVALSGLLVYRRR